MSAPAVLVLAGLDPSGGAGLLADAEAIRACGARPFCLATALTVQTSRRALRFEPVSPALVLEQARALLEEEPIAALKLGMLGTAAMLDAAVWIARTAKVPLVIDPVLRASSGAPLFDGDPSAYRALFSLGAIVTPNLDECATLLFLDAPPASLEEMALAGRSLLGLGATAALIKGGHLASPHSSTDLLVTAAGAYELAGPRHPGTKRGTGCRLAGALAAQLASGKSLLVSARLAKAYVGRYLVGSHEPAPAAGSTDEGAG